MRPKGLIRVFIATFKEQFKNHYCILAADATVSVLGSEAGS